jgi:SAM-dependent methyltransferase
MAASKKRFIRDKVMDRLVNYAIHVDRKERSQVYAYGQDLIVSSNRNISMSLPGADLSITPSIAISGGFEDAEVSFMEQVLKGGDFVVDAGCNIGVFTLAAARKVGPFGRVFAFDPNPLVLEHLKRSLFMNHWHDRVRILQYALGEIEDNVSVCFSKYALGDASHSPDARSFQGKTVEWFGDINYRSG